MYNIALNDLKNMVKAASLGKIMNGLVHNLNGPLQNISIEMEMIGQAIAREGQSDNIKKLNTRINRMEEAFDHINELIRTIITKTEAADNYENDLKLNDFLQQELWFLEANLYYKHHVQTELDLDISIPNLNHLPDGFGEALAWLLYELVQELEKQEVKILRLRTTLRPSALEIGLTTSGGVLSEEFLGLLELDPSRSKSFRIFHDTAATILALTILKRCGVSFRVSTATTSSSIVLELPMNNHLS
ncbi:hypothetical protein ACFL9T_00195 [Thermodesulfobacteriota bacterium]